MKKEEITTAKNIFAEISPVAEWNFSDIEEELDKAFDNFQWIEVDAEDIRKMIEEILQEKLEDVFKAAIIAADAEDEEAEDDGKYEEGVKYAAGEWSSLVFERSEKFATEQEAIDTYVC